MSIAAICLIGAAEPLPGPARHVTQRRRAVNGLAPHDVELLGVHPVGESRCPSFSTGENPGPTEHPRDKRPAYGAALRR